MYKKVIRYEMNEMESGGKSEDGVCFIARLT